jgi:topoisomerase IV subunit A
VDFIPNYDGSFEEPKQLPARLPFNLLNGASGIAVGLATEIPSHNLREVADACVALIKNPKLSDEDLLTLHARADYPGGGQIISPASDIADAYRTGRGSLKVRARWKIEDLARGQWQLVVTELPPGVSSRRCWKRSKRSPTPRSRPARRRSAQDQTQLKASMLAVLDTVRDESSKDAPVRLVFEPKSSRIEQQELITSCWPTPAWKVCADQPDDDRHRRPADAEEPAPDAGGVDCVPPDHHHPPQPAPLQKVLDRIHILEGRQLVLLNIDEVIRIIRHSDEPKPALIEAFKLSDRQAEDILEIRLRQLARLEAIKIEQELKELRESRASSKTSWATRRA